MSNQHTFVEQQIKFILLLFVLSFSFGRIAQLVAHSLRPRFESPAPHLTKFFFLSVYDDILLTCDFYISFSLFKLVFFELRWTRHL